MKETSYLMEVNFSPCWTQKNERLNNNKGCKNDLFCSSNRSHHNWTSWRFLKFSFGLIFYLWRTDVVGYLMLILEGREIHLPTVLMMVMLHAPVRIQIQLHILIQKQNANLNLWWWGGDVMLPKVKNTCTGPSPLHGLGWPCETCLVSPNTPTTTCLASLVLLPWSSCCLSLPQAKLHPQLIFSFIISIHHFVMRLKIRHLMMIQPKHLILSKLSLVCFSIDPISLTHNQHITDTYQNN